eukprot:CAMPEP_0184858670 /NCGR_PEP_ID=MMETSP0580-20130426/3754_1 /TAXON_ID=1118495 /ORGANISM="Dactyliosolen fragilissimus" /LENGTH=789 /DNA_ID=CAMNT_0027354951 /DNA_START=700 /DNA_END=3066 /DNA_ORIENTATION=+
MTKNDNDYELNDDEEEYDYEAPPSIPSFLESSSAGSNLNRGQLEGLTVAQLRQQLRLRGQKVSGRKVQLIDRLMLFNNVSNTQNNGNKHLNATMGIEDGSVRKTKTSHDSTMDAQTLSEQDSSSSSSHQQQKISKAREFAQSRGKELIDVSAYMDQDDKGKAYRSSRPDLESNMNEINLDKVEVEISNNKGDNDEDEISSNKDDEDKSSSSSSPETWGEEARIVADYEGRSVIVDNLSRTETEFIGSNRTRVKAYVVASREALTPYLMGGNRGIQNHNNNTTSSLYTKYDVLSKSYAEVRKTQERREEETKRSNNYSRRNEDINVGEDKDDEEGHYSNVLERDYGDYGPYGTTGAQVSAKEIRGVLFLSDVRGPFHPDNMAFADRIAFECQPAVVFAPDMFRGDPWNLDDDGDDIDNNNGRTYEKWRNEACNEARVNIDVRAAAETMREQYGVSSVAVFGMCFGGGRALEAAAGRCFGSKNNGYGEEDITGLSGPPRVKPSACIAWYPTRYDAESLFGKNGRKDSNNSNDETKYNTAVMSIFAGDDDLPGATRDDATKLKNLLGDDPRIKDHMVKIFPGQPHGFAHMGISKENLQNENDEDMDPFLEEEFGGSPSIGSVGRSGDGEVAYLLSTAWMETYSRVFLPTIGPAVRDGDPPMSSYDYDNNDDPDDTNQQIDRWTSLEMVDLTNSKSRNVRQEIEEALEAHQDVELELERMHPDNFKMPVDELEDTDNTLMDILESTRPLGLSPDDSPEDFLEKLEEALERGLDLDTLPGFGEIPLDSSGQAYW